MHSLFADSCGTSGGWLIWISIVDVPRLGADTATDWFRTGDVMLDIRVRNLCVGYSPHGLERRQPANLFCFYGIDCVCCMPHRQKKKKVDISVRHVLSHSNKLNVNFIQSLQAFSSLSRDFLQCFFFLFPSRQWFFKVCACVKRKNSHFLSPAHKTLSDALPPLFKWQRCGLCSPLSSTHLF